MIARAKAPVIGALFLVSLLILYKGYSYYRYTQTEPGFCNSCHLMEEAFKDWRLSSHSEIICQKCHQLGMVEANKMLLNFALKGKRPDRQDHGRKTPWKTCTQCHSSEAAQGSKTLRASYGHARHVYMQGLGCKVCHSGQIHNFPVPHDVCQGCHKDKVVHGMGTAGLYCLNCHNYGEERPKMVSPERCYSCHQSVPKKGVMAALRCYDCHYPHGKLRLEAKDCLGRCHSNEARVGKHGLHLKKATSDCLLCHRPHVWRVGKTLAKTLCTKCHSYKDPAEFIY